jgi:hypothetical protein
MPRTGYPEITGAAGKLPYAQAHSGRSCAAEELDEAFAENGKVTMRGAHIYEVRFSESGKGRWVEEVVREIEEQEP